MPTSRGPRLKGQELEALTALARQREREAELIGLKLKQEDKDGLLPRVEVIRRGVTHMEALVRDLLDTASIQSGGLAVHLQVEDVTAIVNQVAELLRPVVASAKQTLEVMLPEGPLRARCDGRRVFQVLSNLVGNASKFSPDGG